MGLSSLIGHCWRVNYFLLHILSPPWVVNIDNHFWPGFIYHPFNCCNFSVFDFEHNLFGAAWIVAISVRQLEWFVLKGLLSSFIPLVKVQMSLKEGLQLRKANLHLAQTYGWRAQSKIQKASDEKEEYSRLHPTSQISYRSRCVWKKVCNFGVGGLRPKSRKL